MMATSVIAIEIQARGSRYAGCRSCALRGAFSPVVGLIRLNDRQLSVILRQEERRVRRSAVQERSI